MRNSAILKAGLIILGLAICVNCSRRPTSTADIPRLISQAHKVSVAPFTQPLNPSQLISGQIPEFQGRIPADALQNLDMRLREALITGTNRQYTFLPARDLPNSFQMAHSSGQPTGFDSWLEFGRKTGAEYLLIPQVLDWHEREGSEAGVTSSAHVRLEFFLMDVPRKTIVGRSVFEEKQVGLIDNLLTVGDFVKRKGQWVSAGDLASDGMVQAIKDLGL